MDRSREDCGPDARNVQRLIDDQQYLLDRANEDLTEFDSQPAMVTYEAQRQQIYKQALADRDSALRRLDAQYNDLLKARNDLLAQRIREDLVLKDLKARYQ